MSPRRGPTSDSEMPFLAVMVRYFVHLQRFPSLVNDNPQRLEKCQCLPARDGKLPHSFCIFLLRSEEKLTRVAVRTKGYSR